jgi:hypothetical protein
MTNQHHASSLYTQLDNILNSNKYEQLQTAYKTQHSDHLTVLTGEGWLVLYIGKCPSFRVKISIFDNRYVKLSDIDEYYKTRAMFLMNDLMVQLIQDPNSTNLVKILPHFLEGLTIYLRDSFDLCQMNISTKVNLQSEILTLKSSLAIVKNSQ